MPKKRSSTPDDLQVGSKRRKFIVTHHSVDAEVSEVNETIAMDNVAHHAVDAGVSEAIAMENFIRLCTNVNEENVSSLEQLSFLHQNITDRLVIANISTSMLPDITAEDLETQRCQWAENGDTILQALILPREMVWPTFFDKKDEKSVMSEGKRILFRRVAKHALRREQETGQSLCDNYSVIYIGVPGIGKTLSLNYVLLRCLHSWSPDGSDELKYANFPFRRLIFRLGTGFYVITNTTKIGDEKLSTDVTYVKSKKLDDIDECCDEHNYTREDTLLLLELGEDEHEVSRLPINLIGTVSSKGADNTFKSCYKGNGRFYLLDPWSYSECLAMGLVLDAAAGRRSDEDGCMAKLVEKQFKYTGGVLRSLLTPQEMLPTMLSNRLTNFFSTADVSVYDVPPFWKNYVAPFVRNCSNTKNLDVKDGGDYIFEYLTNTTRDVVFSNVQNVEQMNMLMGHRLAFQNHQLCVLYGALLSGQGVQYNLDEALCRAKYKCYRMTTEANKEENKTITKADEKIKLSSTSGMLPVDDVFPSHVAKLIQFDGQYISLVASDEFDDDAVYESSVINGPVFDFLVVRNDIAYVIQVSDKLPNEHPISVSAMHKVIDSIRSKNGTAKIRYIYLTRETNSDINGIQFTVRLQKTKDDPTKKEKTIVKKGALNDLLAMKDKIEEADYESLLKVNAEKIEMYMATSPLFKYYE